MNKNQFANSTEFNAAVKSSTLASFGGSGYSVEFFPNGNHRVLWDNQIGNLYVSKGDIRSIPYLTEGQMDGVDEENYAIEDAIEFYIDELRELFLED